MQEFEFDLQSLLNLREQEEKILQKELTELRTKYKKAQQKLMNAKERKQRWQNKLHGECETGIELEKLRRYRNYIEYLEDEIEEFFLQLKHWEEKIEDCKEKLLTKVKERKSLSKLKERKYEEYWEEFLRLEQKLNDEIAINNYNH